MRRILRSAAVEAALLAALSIVLFSGIGLIPFHPDEASLLFQSRDLEALFSHPLEMAWTDSSTSTPEMTYRLLNPPLAKYVLGAGRRLAGFGPEAVAVDWDWSKSWAENAGAGALPPARLLAAARTASTAALLGAIVALYWIGRRLGGRGVGLAAALFLGLNALAMLHARRAMAEGTLLLGVTLAFAGMLVADRRPFLAGIAVALAVNTKTSTVPLLMVGWLATVWTRDSSGRLWPSRLRRTVLYACGAFLLTAALQPVLWRDPFGAAQAIWESRQDLLARQVADIQALAPDHVLKAIPQRAVVLVANLYVAPLQYSEVGNYIVEQRASMTAYEGAFGHTFLRGFVGGGLLLAFALVGMFWTWRLWARREAEGARSFGLLFLATAVQAATLVAAVPLPIQRYTLPLLPLLCLWQGIGILGGWPLSKRNAAL